MNQDHSKRLFEEALTLFPGGVNSPVRAFKSVDSQPFVVDRGEGPFLIDVDGHRYLDYVLSWGPLALGHTNPLVKTAVNEALEKGWTYGAPCEAENLLAKKVREIFPSMERMRFVSSGTEAVMGALRLARGFTGRDMIVKCDGGYHGHADNLLVSAGSGLATLGTSSSAGVPGSYASSTLVIPINAPDALEEVMAKYGERIAAFILEPVNGNVGCIPPQPGNLERYREITRENGSLLIFDEVMCGFRASLGGAQERFGVRPDITVLGKVIGGGFPVGAYGASSEMMTQIAPEGPVYQAGTLSGNPIAMTAGLKTLELLQDGAHQTACTRVTELEEGVRAWPEALRSKICFQSVGSMFSLFLTPGPVNNYRDAGKVDGDLFARFHRSLLEKGIYFAPSAFEAGFLSSTHRSEDIAHTLSALEDTLRQLL